MEKRNIRLMSDRYLIQDIKLNKDNESLLELHNRYCRMYYNTCHKFTNFFAASHINKNEMLSHSFYMIYDAAYTFNPDKKIKFITWLGSKTKYFFLNHANSENKFNNFFEFKDDDKELDKSSLSSESKINFNHVEIINMLERHPDKRIKEIFKHRYCYSNKKPPTWKEISYLFNLSSQTIINLHNKGLKILRTKIKKV